MTALEFLRQLNRLNVPLVQTKDVADVMDITVGSAGKYLKLLMEQGFVEKVVHGKWAIKNSEFDPLQGAEFITAPKESYISLQTALFYHGMIEQIPTQMYAVTVDRSRAVDTPMGRFSFHHCHPAFFTGYTYLKPLLNLATPEKALVDYFYFAPTKSRQFTRLPELDIPKEFSWNKVFEFCKKIPSPRTRSLVLKKIENSRAGLRAR